MNPFNVFAPDLLSQKNLIEASAGTGKTYSIALIFLRLLIEKGIPLPQILAVTFTQAATKEMKNRIRLFIQEAIRYLDHQEIENLQIKQIVDFAVTQKENALIANHLKTALLEFDQACIFTIHGFCQKMITENAFECSARFNPELLKNDGPLVLQAIEDYFRSHFYNSSDLFSDYMVQNKITPTTLFQLIRQQEFTPNKIFQIPSEPVPTSTINRQEQEFYSIFKQLYREWTTEKSHLTALLSMPDTLNKRGYSSSKIDAAVNQLNLLFESDRPLHLYLPKASALFCQSKINNAILKNKSGPSHPFFEQMDRLYEAEGILTHSFNIHMMYSVKALFDFVYKTVLEKKQINNKYTYQDLILTLYQALHQSNADRLRAIFQSTYQAILIDEFQDTDTLQFDIFMQLTHTTQASPILFLIGDPKQAIYRFRGADIFAYFNAASEDYILSQRRYTLTSNYRSCAPLVQAVHAIFSRRQHPFVFQQIQLAATQAVHTDPHDQLHQSQQPVSPLKILIPQKKDTLLTSTEAQTLFSNAVVAEILQLLNPTNQFRIHDKLIRPQDITILTRTRYEARKLYALMLNYQIPAVLSKADNVFNTSEARSLWQILNAIAHYDRIEWIRAALLTEIMGFSTVPKDCEPWCEKFRYYHQLWAKRKFLKMMHLLISENHLKPHLLSLTNLLHLIELIQDQITLQTLSIAGTLSYLSDQLTHNKLDQEEYELRMDTDEDAVHIQTIHRSKGLEFPIVFCPFLWHSNRFRPTQNELTCIEYHADLKTILALNPDDEAIAKKEQEDLAESIRLAYVALTRAKYRCYVYWGQIQKSDTSALAYLFHQEDLTKLAENTPIEIETLPPTFELKPLTQARFSASKASFSPFTGTISLSWKIESFTSLSQVAIDTALTERPDYDNLVTDSEKTDSIQQPTMRQFPKGPQVGVALHQMLEQTDFEFEPDKLMIKAILDQYHLSPLWIDLVSNMILDIGSVHLQSQFDTFSLNQIPAHKKITELSFYFPFDADIMTGFIDLIFEYNNRFYILDWKSNYLGPDLLDYEAGPIQKAMNEHVYHLQYKIYTAALIRYLKQRLPEFDYSHHFGGVFYIFLRGINSDPYSQTGVFYHCSPKTEIDNFFHHK